MTYRNRCDCQLRYGFTAEQPDNLFDKAVSTSPRALAAADDYKPAVAAYLQNRGCTRRQMSAVGRAYVAPTDKPLTASLCYLHIQGRGNWRSAPPQVGPSAKAVISLGFITMLFSSEKNTMFLATNYSRNCRYCCHSVCAVLNCDTELLFCLPRSKSLIAQDSQLTSHMLARFFFFMVALIIAHSITFHFRLASSTSPSDHRLLLSTGPADYLHGHYKNYLLATEMVAQAHNRLFINCCQQRLI